MSVTTLKPTINDDVPIVMAMERDDANHDFVGQSTAEQHEGMIASAQADHLSIFNSENELVGFALLLHHSGNVIELKRIVIAQAGKGFGQSGIQLLKKYAFENLNVQKLWLDVFDTNERAIHVYKKLNFKVEETKYGSIVFRGETRNQVIMAISREEYLACEK